MDLFDPDLTRVEFMIRKPDQTPCCSPLNDPIDKRADASVFREIATRGLSKSHLGERPMR
jgi:hypothetical protein